jgi:hypothetical protein
MLVVQRNTQTVRAHVPRTGEQKWNFSVSLHDVAFHPALDPCQPLDEEDRQGVLVDDLSEVVAEDVVLKAGLEKTRVFKKTQSSGGFFSGGRGGVWGFFFIFAQKKSFLGFFSFTFRCIQTLNYNNSY